MLRVMKIVLVATVALWGFVSLFHNVIDLSGTTGAVTAATSMTTIEGGTTKWQATSNIIIVWAGALLIMGSKAAAGIFCSMGAARMWSARHEDPVTFMLAKEFALTGCAIAVAMLFGGFIVIAETWFELWRSGGMRGPVLDSAFRYGGFIMLIAIFVAIREND